MSKSSQIKLAAEVKAIRAALTAGMPRPITLQQRQSQADRKVIGPCWVSRVMFPAPLEHTVCELVHEVIQLLGDGSEDFTMPALEPVYAEWTGFRAHVSAKEPEPPIPEVEKYACLMKEVVNPLTILFIYGGGHSLNGPATRRVTAAKLSQLSGGRCLIVRYRPAPQNPFPAALIDVLTSYLSLLHPPPGSQHDPVPASNIILAGDSSGTALVLPVIQIILAARNLQRTSAPSVLFHGRRVLLPMPAGLTLQSPYLDPGDALPCWDANFSFDIFPADLKSSQTNPRFPPEKAWPSSPARGLFYCETSMLCHPLVNPILAQSWQGSPPMYIAVGSKERVVDAVKVLAQQAARQGVEVVWDEYELMPHSWPMILPDYPQSMGCYRMWAEACVKFVAGGGKGERQSKGNFTHFEDMRTESKDVEAVTPLTMEQVKSMMRVRQASIRPWTGKAATKSSISKL